MNDIFIYLVKLPPGIHEMVVPCNDGFCIYLDSNCDEFTRIKAFGHALAHIEHWDFEKSDVQKIECECHKRPDKPLEYYRQLFGERVFHCGYIE